MPAQASAPPKSAPPPAREAAKAVPAAVAETAPAAAEKALVRLPGPPVEEAGEKLAAPLARLPVELDVAVPVEDFRVRNLLALEPGQVIETRWANGRDMPLCSGEVQLAWSEFEVIDAQLAVRVTQLV
jgi:flagellar motor switch/type III secretory pathway protein FliN